MKAYDWINIEYLDMVRDGYLALCRCRNCEMKFEVNCMEIIHRFRTEYYWEPSCPNCQEWYEFKEKVVVAHYASNEIQRCKN